VDSATDKIKNVWRSGDSGADVGLQRRGIRVNCDEFQFATISEPGSWYDERGDLGDDHQREQTERNYSERGSIVRGIFVFRACVSHYLEGTPELHGVGDI